MKKKCSVIKHFILNIFFKQRRKHVERIVIINGFVHKQKYLTIAK